jgi:hypothetical protein
VADVGEAGVAGDPFGPLLDGAAFDLDALAAVAAGQVVVMRAGAALAVERLAAAVTDGVDAAVVAEHLEVAVDRGEPDVLAAPPQLGVDLLGAAEAGQVVQSLGERGRLPRPAHLGATGRVLRAGFGLRRAHKRTLQPAGQFC